MPNITKLTDSEYKNNNYIVFTHRINYAVNPDMQLFVADSCLAPENFDNLKLIAAGASRGGTDIIAAWHTGNNEEEVFLYCGYWNSGIVNTL